MMLASADTSVSLVTILICMLFVANMDVLCVILIALCLALFDFVSSAMRAILAQFKGTCRCCLVLEVLVVVVVAVLLAALWRRWL